MHLNCGNTPAPAGGFLGSCREGQGQKDEKGKKSA
jgi:hypothetical protein